MTGDVLFHSWAICLRLAVVQYPSSFRLRQSSHV